MAALTPTIYWGQNKTKTFLKVELTEITSGPEIDIESDSLSLEAHGTGVRGHNAYSFKVNFFRSIDPKTSKYKVTGRAIQFELTKVKENENWPSLVEGQRKYSWIKTDFDHFSFEDTEPSSGEDNQDDITADQNELLEKLEREMKEEDGNSRNGVLNSLHDLKSLYLFMYNMFQWIGYCFVFTTICYKYLQHGLESRKDVFTSVGPALMVCQYGAILEILHPMLGWVKTGVFMPLTQVFGRGLILFGLLYTEPRLHEQDVVWWLFLTWSAIETIRYPYYMLNVVGREWSFVTWIRYTAWIPLYPMGFVFEGILMMSALPLFVQTKRWCIALPNNANIAFDFSVFLRLYMLAFLPGMYMLMQRMYEQRKKKLGSSLVRAAVKRSHSIGHSKKKVP